MIYLLDTNVVSQQMAPRPHPAARHFLETTPVDETFLSVITLMEIRAGIEKLKPDSAKRVALERWLTRRVPKHFPNASCRSQQKSPTWPDVCSQQKSKPHALHL